METSIGFIAITIAFVIVLIWAWRILNWVWLKPKRLERSLRNAGFSGNQYRLLYGDIKDFFQMSGQAKSRPISLSDDIVPRVAPFQYELIRKYGKNSFMWLGQTPRVNIMDPDQLKEVLSKIYEYPKPSMRFPINLLVTGIVCAEGEKWSRHRKIINPAFHLEKLKHMLPAFSLSCMEMINNWVKLISSEGSCELDVWPYLRNLTSDVISRTAFGSNYTEGRRIFELQRELTELCVSAMPSLVLPGWRFLPTKLNKRVKEVDREIKILLRGVINNRIDAMNAGDAAKEDLLGIMLQSNMEAVIEENQIQAVGMSIEDVIEECKIFYFAGNETTSVLLVWTMVLLSKYQEWQKRARDEVLQVFGKEKPDFDGLSHLKIVTMILHEVLRLYPPVPNLSRTILKEMKLGKISLPAGVEVFLPIIFAHYDKEVWGDDVKEFKPERFSEGVSKATKGQLSYFPFSSGPRICIGQNFALIEAKVALAMILQHFSFGLSPSYTHAPASILTLQPQHGAHIVLHKL